VIHAGVVEHVDHCAVRFAATRSELLGDSFQARLGPAGQENSRAFRREFFGDSRANRAAGAEDDSIFSL